MLVSPAELVADAKADITETSVTEFHAADETDCILIDIRDMDEFLAGHLPGAISGPRGMLEFKIHELVKNGMCDTEGSPESQSIVLYCGTGARSALGAKCLQSMGYQNVRSIAGGIDAWNAAQLPLEKAGS